jgi:SsrA-binding protein
MSKGHATKPIVLADNRRARHEYEILESIEAGLALLGSETKAIRDGKISLAEAYCQFHAGELWLIQAHVGEYVQAHGRNHEPLRKRKLLLHRKQLDDWTDRVKLEGLTIVPLDVHLNGRMLKVQIGLVRGKKLHDKRHDIKQREAKREMDRAKREAGR